MNVFVLVLSLTQAFAGPICRSLALEGGGSWGAYESGVIWAITNLTNPSDITWNAVSGISVGSINAGGLAQFPMGKEKGAADFLLSIWRSVNSSSDIYKEWDGGLAAGLLFHSGVYNTAPLQVFLRNHFLYPISRNFTLGSTNFDTGLFSTFNESVGSAAVDAVVCSASPPPVFPPHQFEGYTWADGGCVMNLDVSSAVERCLQITEEENIITDMILDSPYAPLPNETSFKTKDVFSRVKEISSYDGSVWYTYNAFKAFPKVYFRYLITPAQPMPGGRIPLNFTPSVLEAEIQLGINDTVNYFKSPRQARTIIEELYNSNKEKVVYP